MKEKLKVAALVLGLVAGGAGSLVAQDHRYYDRDDDDYRYDNDYGRDQYRQALHIAREFGFRDGTRVAREDLRLGKPFNSSPRGRYDDDDHGYRRSFGDKHEYREHYARAYRDGYIRTYQSGGDYR